MDKIIEKKKGLAAAFTKRAVPYWMGGVVVVFVMWLVLRDNSSTLRVKGYPHSHAKYLNCPSAPATTQKPPPKHPSNKAMPSL